MDSQINGRTTDLLSHCERQGKKFEYRKSWFDCFNIVFVISWGLLKISNAYGTDFNYKVKGRFKDESSRNFSIFGETKVERIFTELKNFMRKNMLEDVEKTMNETNNLCIERTWEIEGFF